MRLNEAEVSYQAMSENEQNTCRVQRGAAGVSAPVSKASAANSPLGTTYLSEP